MNTIVITGLDGSGKSTIFKRLAALPEPRSFELLLLPHFDLDFLKDEPELQPIAAQINALGQEADERGLPVLKALALMGAMLLFAKIERAQQQKGQKNLLCERHPLIDAPVYAAFYAAKMNPERFPEQLIRDVDLRYGVLLDYLNQLLPADDVKGMAGLAGFIYRWFHLEQRLGLTELECLFNTRAPKQIYYLKADAAVLMRRLSERTSREAHENIETLRMLGQAYEKWLQQFADITTQVDAENFASLDRFFERISSNLAHGL